MDFLQGYRPELRRMPQIGFKSIDAAQPLDEKPALLRAAGNRRQLHKIADQDHLPTAKRPVFVHPESQLPKTGIDCAQHVAAYHRYLIHDKCFG